MCTDMSYNLLELKLTEHPHCRATPPKARMQ
jgi:hypothetical protein